MPNIYVYFVFDIYLCRMILRINDILKGKKLTNREFARLMGKSPQYTNAVAKERVGVSLKMLSKMAEVLNVPLKELFN